MKIFIVIDGKIFKKTTTCERLKIMTFTDLWNVLKEMLRFEEGNQSVTTVFCDYRLCSAESANWLLHEMMMMMMIYMAI